jgi:hypothetical protein
MKEKIEFPPVWDLPTRADGKSPVRYGVKKVKVSKDNFKLGNFKCY